jgi:hypothetical protein
MKKYGACAVSNIGLFLGITFLRAAYELVRHPEDFHETIDGSQLF